MALDDRRSAAIAIFERGWNLGAFGDVAGLFAPTFTLHVRGTSRTTTAAEFEAIVGTWRHGFPDLHFELHDVVVEGDLVALRATLTGTHLGAWGERPPSGRQIEVDHMFLLRFEGDRLVEVWEVLDSATLVRQLASASDGATA